MSKGQTLLNQCYLSLKKSYTTIQNILLPTLSSQKQKLLSSLFALISNQLTTLISLTENKNLDNQSAIDISSFSKEIGFILSQTKETEQSYIISHELSISYDHCINRVRCFSNNTTRIYSYTNKKDYNNYNTLRASSSKKSYNTLSPKWQSKSISVNKAINHSAKKKNILNKSKSLKEEQKTIDQSQDNKEKKKLLIDYEQFAEKTVKDFEKIGAKPSNYAKYLVKKYKDVVERFDKIDNEEMKLSGRTLSQKSNSVKDLNNQKNLFDINQYIRKNKKKLYKKGFFFDTMNKTSISQLNESDRIHVHK